MVAAEADVLNRERYDDAKTVSFYRDRTNLFPAEQRAFDRFVAPGLALLDIGVGAGRTTGHLIDSSDYVGIDWSPEMVTATRQAYPSADVRIGDATCLDFPNERFDLVIFSFNGIDYVSLRNRREVYREVNRVLKPGGIFIFSSHNPRWICQPPVGRSPRVVLGWLRRLPAAVARSASTRRFRQGRGSYVDPVHGGLVTYASAPAIVSRELADTGFKLNSVDPGNTRLGLTTPWFYYTAKKA